MPSASGLHLNFDDAWPVDGLPVPAADLREWGPRVRFSAPAREIAKLDAHTDRWFENCAPFVVYGSGDFHHLSALWVKRAAAEPLTLVSFDNHPDWDIRPPAWCCGSWINRALDLPTVERAAVWGCGNFECWGWHRITGNHRDVRSGRLEVHPWADERSAADQAKPWAITQANWREKFVRFAGTLVGRRLYITVDLDCLRAGEALTNWENGRFTVNDICWALDQLQAQAPIVAGDICGAYSAPAYARWTQRFASESDHPKLPPLDPTETRRINFAAFAAIWPRLCGER